MYWDPFDEIQRMHEEMDRMFSRHFGLPDRQLIGHDGKKNELMTSSTARAPVCHMHETETNIIASFELPGVKKGDIECIVEDDHIEIKVESKTEKKSKDEKSYLMSSQSFYRRVPLPKEVISDKATAEYNNGVLRVEMPKRPDGKKKKRIDIK